MGWYSHVTFPPRRPGVNPVQMHNKYICILIITGSVSNKIAYLALGNSILTAGREGDGMEGRTWWILIAGAGPDEDPGVGCRRSPSCRCQERKEGRGR